jgi:two-component system, NarL family, sensor histidine kinase LiaS
MHPLFGGLVCELMTQTSFLASKAWGVPTQFTYKEKDLTVMPQPRYNRNVVKTFFKRRAKPKQGKERFRKLAWKFTVSHTLTVFAAFVLLELLVLLFLYLVLLVISANDVLTYAPKALRDLSPRFAPYLLRNPVDTEALENTLLELEPLTSPDKADFNVPIPRSGQNTLAIVEANGRVVAVSNPETRNLLNKSLADELSPEELVILNQALAGQESSSPFSLSLLKPLVVAAPLTSADGAIIGTALLYQTTLNQEQLSSSTFLLIVVSLLLFLLFAAPIGTLFGALRARGLTKRLQRLTVAANAWSQGDFSARVQDPSQDEFGELTKQLNSMAQELQSHVQTKEQLATLQERQRIARDLHDSVKQQVFATTLQIGAARLNLDKDKTVVQKHLTEAERMATEARAELTRLINALKPAELEHKSFTTALSELAESWTAQHGMKLEQHLSDLLPLSDDVQQVLYRVAQEALANIAKHSEARNVGVRLEQDLNNVILEISDDGKGFKLSKVQQGVGLTSMRERLEAIGGKLDIQSIPNKGTLLTASIVLGAKRS